MFINEVEDEPIIIYLIRFLFCNQTPTCLNLQFYRSLIFLMGETFEIYWFSRILVININDQVVNL